MLFLARPPGYSGRRGSLSIDHYFIVFVFSSLSSVAAEVPELVPRLRPTADSPEALE
jgi:hypothetical protein